MKIYVHDKGVILVGKAWEVRQKLMEYRLQFDSIKAWVDNVSKK